ncbi:hypothetical protein ACJIZ3_014807 [Penstemon smallii]|uniref:CCHC-type domain-containing protein n=1 Tax=Penstemon smallii TaxID=265156 RepID=A0ABD3RLE9_9LAMI
MESEDLIKLPASRPEIGDDGPCESGYEAIETDSELKNEVTRDAPGNILDNPCDPDYEAIEADSLPLNFDVNDEINGEASETIFYGDHEIVESPLTTDVEKDADNNTPAMAVDVKLAEAVEVLNEVSSFSYVNTENGSIAVQRESILSNNKKNETLFSGREIDTIQLSGVKRPRLTVDEQQPSVHVIYSSLTRESKRKLEELLQQWSRWHAQSCSSANDSNVVLESGEETFFPALNVGLDKSSAVTFWVDNQTMIQSGKEVIPLDGTSVPLYDRGYALALTSGEGTSSLDGGVEKLDTSRCFNCSSYSHALKDCPKPRNTVAVNNARKQHRSLRNQHANSRNSTRYYQSSRGGKYDGLMPGVLDPETRQLLGLGELDPPPWLNRMREIGYPPGYLDPDEDDQPSGITIFGDESNKEEGEEGEILDASYTAEPSKKKSVDFPGINAPIPENADGWLWAATSSSSFNPSRDRDRSHRRYNNNPISENLSIRGHHHEPRWPRDVEDDGPPGCDPGTSPSLANHFSRRHSDYDPSYTSPSPRGGPSAPWSPNHGRSSYDRGRRSPLVQDGSPKYGQSGNYPYSHSR